MAAVCSLSEFVVQQHPTIANRWYVWDKVNKVSTTRNYASVPDFYLLSPGALIDVAENAGKVYLITKGPGGTFPIFTSILSSTLGSTVNKLVSAVRSGYTLTVVMYSSPANEVTTLTYSFQQFTTDSPAVAITPCFNNFSIADGTILKSWCDGFTLNQTIFRQSPFGVTTEQEFNSVTCGYSAPIPPFRISEEIIVEYENRCFVNPVFFIWKNTLGGWDSYLFEANQTENIATESEGVFGKYYTNISDVDNPITERGKTAQGKVIYGAEDVSTQRKIGIIQLLYSNKVYIYNPVTEQVREVKVSSGTFLVRNTEGEKHSIEFEVEPAKINTIKN